jgi:hypothetical protein
MKAWNFDRYVGKRLKAEGIRVHAKNLEDATSQAYELLVKTHPDGRFNRETLIFRDNEPCVSKCSICGQGIK